MGKLLKYEFKRDYKSYIGMYIIITLINFVTWMVGSDYKNILVIACLSISGFTAFIVTFVSTIKAFGKELSEDSGYLTFTLPRTGYEVLGTKLFMGLLWFCATGIVVFVISTIGVNVVAPIPSIINELAKEFSIDGIVSLLVGLFSIAVLLVMIYFSATIGKVALRNKKGGKAFSFFVFIVISILLSVVSVILLRTFPQTINLHGISAVSGGFSLTSINGVNSLSVDSSGVHVNISIFILNIVVFVGMFMGTGWMLENSIDL